MQANKAIGWLFISGATAVLIPYILLTQNFHYPAILRMDTGVILGAFNQGGTSLIVTWFAFAMAGLPLIPAYILLGKKYEERSVLIRVATNIGLIGLIVQVIGLLRWTFVVPVISQSYMQASTEMERVTAIMNFRTLHQFAGVLLGEHLGQLFTIAWTIMISWASIRHSLMPRWLNVFGIIAALIYLPAQLELFSTVIPGITVIDLAGFLGSTLWLFWLIAMGVFFLITNRPANS